MDAVNLQLADDLARVLAGDIDIESVLDSDSYGEVLGYCFHGLQHFASDEDLRERDSEYKDMQESEMRKLIALLREGAPEEKIREIHFLGRSR